MAVSGLGDHALFLFDIDMFLYRSREILAQHSYVHTGRQSEMKLGKEASRLCFYIPASGRRITIQLRKEHRPIIPIKRIVLNHRQIIRHGLRLLSFHD